jgi:arsenate reductase
MTARDNSRDNIAGQVPASRDRLPRKRVLFLCIGNACRSQIAEAMATKLASDVIEASSAGVYPLGHIPPETREVLKEKGISCGKQSSKGFTEDDLRAVDLIINMSGYPGEKLFDDETLRVEDWDVGDPFGSDLEVYRDIRDQIERRLTKLAESLRPAQRRSQGSAEDAAP